MKAAPFFVAGLTASAALAAGALLTAEDRALFEPQHAMLVGLVDGATVSPMASQAPRRAAAPVAAKPQRKP
ncbi:MAG: hypothetical protein KF891_13845 [Rhizobacter sp.]|nr:hypothetical protein [Rhizobacter sp.]